MRKILLALLFSLFGLCTQANATVYWSSAAAIDEMNIGSVSSTGITFWLMHGVSSLGTCGTTTFNSTTYVLFELNDAVVGSAGTVEDALWYATIINRTFAQVVIAYNTGITFTTKVDDSLKDSNGYCYVQAVRIPN